MKHFLEIGCKSASITSIGSSKSFGSSKSSKNSRSRTNSTDSRPEGANGSVTNGTVTNGTTTTGHIDLLIYLPSGQVTTMTVERRTPLLDVLVKICTGHSLQPSEHSLQPVDKNGPSQQPQPTERSFRCKPSTMVGLLGTQRLRVVPKQRPAAIRSIATHQHQHQLNGGKPFEDTFRLKVHLPRNQLYVTRVGRNVLLREIMDEVCEEKRLDADKYAFMHPAKSDETLDLKLTIGDYQLTEVYLVSCDQISRRIEDSYKATNGGGVFHSMPRKTRYTNGEASPTLQVQARGRLCASYTSLFGGALSRKKRPAPTPPAAAAHVQPASPVRPAAAPATRRPESPEEEQRPRNENGFPSCHSRNSSDSSGYHEASLLSDHCVTPPPSQGDKPGDGSPPAGRSPPPPDRNSVNGGEAVNGHWRQYDQNYNSLSCTPIHSKSVPNLALRSRKKKAAPPPPILRKDSVISTTPSPTLVASQAR